MRQAARAPRSDRDLVVSCVSSYTSAFGLTSLSTMALIRTPAALGQLSTIITAFQSRMGWPPYRFSDGFPRYPCSVRWKPGRQPDSADATVYALPRRWLE